MKIVRFISLLVVFVLLGTACGVARADGVGLSLTKNRYSSRRLSSKRYSGTGYSLVKFQPRRFTSQRNLGKHVTIRRAPRPKRGTRTRTRLVVRNASTLRRAANRRELKRRYNSRSARNRTVQGGFGTRN